MNQIVIIALTKQKLDLFINKLNSPRFQYNNEAFYFSTPRNLIHNKIQKVTFTSVSLDTTIETHLYLFETLTYCLEIYFPFCVKKAHGMKFVQKLAVQMECKQHNRFQTVTSHPKSCSNIANREWMYEANPGPCQRRPLQLCTRGRCFIPPANVLDFVIHVFG